MRLPRRPRTRFLLAGGLVLAVALAWLARPGGRVDASAPLRIGDLLVEVEVTGTLEAARSDVLGPPALSGIWSFEISSLAPEGEEVEAGAPVLAFDTSEGERTLQEKISERAEAEKQIEKLASDLDLESRDVELRLAEAGSRQRLAALKLERASDVVAAREFAEARLDHQLASREVAYQELRRDLAERRGRAQRAALTGRRDRAAARVREIEEQIERMTVRAPNPGTVTYVVSGDGDKKKVGDTVWRRQKVVEIPDLERMLARGEVEEVEASRIAAGQTVALRLDAYPDLEYRGRVERLERAVRRRSENDPAKVFRLEIALDGTDRLRMRPGMRFTGRVLVERAPGVLLLPLEAVLPTDAGPLVEVAGVTGWRPVRPRLGRRGNRHVEVLEGLEPGDRVSLLPRLSGEGRR